jgi:ligand-binding sensor domain-containing protein/nitrogen-specific signal transduction histidine kinase
MREGIIAMLRKFILLFFLLVPSLHILAQPYYFRHYQVESGLSNNTVYCSIQDKNGFMWFGTRDGLDRFDGYRFKTFNSQSKDESSLTSDYIFSLAIDSSNQLWVGCEKGLYSFDAQKDQLVTVIDSLKNIQELFVDKKGQIWFISNVMLCHYDSKQKKLTTFPVSKYFEASSICQTQDGSMWFSTNDGFVQRYNQLSNYFTRYSVFDHSPPATSHSIEKIVAADSTFLFIGTSSQGIKKFDCSTGTYSDVLQYNHDRTTIFVRDILKVHEGEFWFATESGLFILNTQNGSVTNLKKNFLDPYSLSDNAVYTLNKDKEGGIWAGTFFGGINYFSKQSVTFQKYLPDYSKNSISGSAVREICEDGFGNIWIGTEDAGLNKLHLKNGTFRHFQPAGTSADISYSNIHGLLADGNKLWIGTFKHGLDIMDIRREKIVRHYDVGDRQGDLKSDFIVTLLQTKNKTIYIGTATCLMKYNPKEDNFLLVDAIPRHQFISALIEDHEGTIWAGTHSRGIYYFNPQTGQRGHIENIPFNKNSLTSNNINAIYEDSSNFIWIATEGGGLCKLSKTQNKITRITTKEGLPSNFVYKILQDNKKSLWATTSKGLVNIDLNNTITRIYTKENGLLNDQFNYNSGYKDAEGKLYFGSVRGMISFRPDSFFLSNYVPQVFFTGLQINNKEIDLSKDSNVLKRSIVYANNLTLNHDQSSFSIDFAAITYTSPEMTEYSYRMEGLDNDWTYIKSNRKVYFTNLKAGHYEFVVKAAVNSVWGQEKKLIIDIKPPFWATRWAYVVYVFCVLLLAYFIFQNYHRIQMERKAKEIYEAKIEFFTNIAHEIKTPLTLIKGPVENLRELVDELPVIKEDVVTMERNTNRLINLINQVLDFRQTEVKGFRLDFGITNLSEVLKEVYLMFEPVAKKRKLCYTLERPSTPVSIMADAEALHKVFSNLFGNAVKYADNNVSIRMPPTNKEDRYVRIEVRNDGYLIPSEMKEKIFEPFFRLKETQNQKGTGIGLTLARSLVELHDGNINLKTEEDEGMNVFIVTLPLRTIMLSPESVNAQRKKGYSKKN